MFVRRKVSRVWTNSTLTRTAQRGREMNEPSARVEGSDSKNDAINKAFHIAHENGIAGYAIETKYDGWIASAHKPSLRFGEVLECMDNGSMRKA